MANSSFGNVGMIEQHYEIDEEQGIPSVRERSNSSLNSYCGSDDQSSPQSPSRRNSDTSESEHLDYVSEMTPLVGRGDLTRIPSDSSITSVTALPGMTIRSHSIRVSKRLGEGCTIRHSTTKVALRAVQAAIKQQQHNTSPFAVKESYWIDIETPRSSTSDELYEFLKQLRIPPFFVSILAEPSNWSSEVVALKQMTLAVFQILPVDPESDEFVALLSMHGLLVTLSTFPQNNESEGLYNLVSQYMRQRERVPEPSNTGVLLAWVQYHLRRTSRAIRELRSAALSMDEELDQDFANFDFQDIIEAKNCLLRVLSVAEEQRETIEVLAGVGGTEGLDFANCRGTLSVLLATSSSNERLSSRVDKHLNELRERIMTHREEMLNQRLGLLTILSSIFMPLTLLSGIWGMNFDNMPELTVDGAYEKALLGMFLLALCMGYSFHRAGWSN